MYVGIQPPFDAQPNDLCLRRIDKYEADATVRQRQDGVRSRRSPAQRPPQARSGRHSRLPSTRGRRALPRRIALGRTAVSFLQSRTPAVGSSTPFASAARHSRLWVGCCPLSTATDVLRQHQDVVHCRSALPQARRTAASPASHVLRRHRHRIDSRGAALRDACWSLAATHDSRRLKAAVRSRSAPLRIRCWSPGAAARDDDRRGGRSRGLASRVDCKPVSAVSRVRRRRDVVHSRRTALRRLPVVCDVHR